MKSVGKRIIELRTNQSVTQKDLAKAAMVSQPYLSAVESGKKKPSKKVLVAIMKKLKISETEFYKGVLPIFGSPAKSASAQRHHNSIDVKTITRLESQTKDNIALDRALDILFEFDSALEEMRDEHKILFGEIHKLLMSDVRQPTQKAVYFESHKREIEILIEYSTLVEYIVKTRKSWKHRTRLEDLENRANGLIAEDSL